MSGISIGIAEHGDLARITEIYNYCVLNTPVTFDVEACTSGRREPWFRQFGATGRHRLLVAEENGVVPGYVGAARFRPKAAHETTIDCAFEAVGKGMGRRLCGAFFEALRGSTFIFCVGIYAAERGQQGAPSALQIRDCGRV